MDYITIDNFLNKNDCSILRQIINDNLHRFRDGKVLENTNNNDNSKRIAQEWWVKNYKFDVLKKINSKLSNLVSGQIQTSTLFINYNEGGHFVWHNDAMKQDRQEYHDIHLRKNTCIINLNDVEKGGDLEFISGNRVKCEEGKLIIFPTARYNDNNEWEMIEEARHKGNPVIKGFKQILIIWTYCEDAVYNKLDEKYYL